MHYSDYWQHKFRFISSQDDAVLLRLLGGVLVIVLSVRNLHLRLHVPPGHAVELLWPQLELDQKYFILVKNIFCWREKYFLSVIYTCVAVNFHPMWLQQPRHSVMVQA